MNGETVHALRGVSLRVDARRVRRHRRPLGQRQVHPAAAPRRDRHALGRDAWRCSARGSTRCPTASSPGSASPGSASSSSASTCCRCSRPARTSSCRWPRPACRAAERRARARELLAYVGLGHRAGPPGDAALRRRDAARRHRPRARQPAGGAPRRRAHRRARRGHRPRDPRPLPPAQRRRHHAGRGDPRRAARRRGGAGRSTCSTARIRD